MTAPLSVARLPPRRRRRLGLGVLVVLFALLLLLSNLVPLAAEWLWFQALGYERVFTTRLVAEALLGVGIGGLVFAFLYLNLRIAQRGLVPNPLVVQFSAGAAAVDVTRLARRLALPAAPRVPGLLYSTTGPLVGASFSDLHAALTGLRVAGLAAVAGGALVLWGAMSQRLARNALLALGLYFGVLLLGVALYPAMVQRLIVAPNELVKETPQLASHITATRQAWGLDSVVTRDLTGEARLTERDIRANRPTIDNVRLWDRDPLLQTFGQPQEIRTYYDFVSVDDDRYWIDGQYRQVLLSPRELNAASLPTRTFINERLTFTHGMGLTLGPVNQATSEGLPVLFIKDLPPASSVSLRVTRPELYFGELTDSWVFARTHQR